MVRKLVVPILLTIFGCSSASKVATNSDKPTNVIVDTAIQFNIDPDLFQALCEYESRCTVTAINPNDASLKAKKKGIRQSSLGMFQIKLSTARALGFRGTKQQLMLPETNAYYAAKYLNHWYSVYGRNTPKVLSAYNCGRYTPKNNKYVLGVLKIYIKRKVDQNVSI